MLARRSHKNSRQEESSSHACCQFYWHRPLGARADCRRLTVTTTTTSVIKKAALWALPLSFDQVLTEMEVLGRLDTLELDGTRDSYDALTALQWKQLVGRICRRLHPRKVIFHGNGVSDTQRCVLLRQMSAFVQAVELWNSLDHEETLRVLQTCCHGLVELRLIDSVALTAEQVETLLYLMYKKQPPLRALSLHGTPCWDPDTTTLRRFCKALEHSAAALEEAEFGPLLKNDDDENDDADMKAYLSVITKIHRMRHYYYKLRQHTDLSAFSVADDALSVVQHWWQLTHRPHRDNHENDSLTIMNTTTKSLSHHSSNSSC